MNRNFAFYVSTGFNDGLIVPFVFATALCGADQPNNIIFDFGLVMVAMGAIAMSISGYFTIKNEDDEQDSGYAVKSALTIGVSYMLGGVLCLIPFLFFGEKWPALQMSAVVTLVCIAITSVLKSRVFGIHPLTGILRSVVLGGLAAATVFWAARIFAEQ